MTPRAASEWLPLLALSLLVPACLYALLDPGAIGDRVIGVVRAVLGRIPRRRPAQVVQGRAIEDVVADVRRLGRVFHGPHHSHVKAESARHTYDRVLAEGCAALGIEHLLGVLEPGSELDRERARVERLLHVWGVDLGDAA